MLFDEVVTRLAINDWQSPLISCHVDLSPSKGTYRTHSPTAVEDLEKHGLLDHHQGVRLHWIKSRLV